MKKLLKQIEKQDPINLLENMDQGRIEIDREQSITTEDFIISFRLETDIYIEKRNWQSYDFAPEINTIKDDVSISEIEVYDLEHRENLILDDSLLDSVGDRIKDKIEY